ncbi:MAG: FIST C-terminal domain-containing protein [Proteobacteria bacterium]|nr:FIST C-terminal domain-containing protein [Pseudomonadota bacterium]
MDTKIIAAHSEKLSANPAQDIISQIRQGFKEDDPVMIIVFASAKHSLSDLTAQLKKEFSTSLLLGSSTSGEFTHMKETNGGVACFALGGDYKVYAGMGRNLKQDVESAVDNTIKALPSEVEGYPYCTGIMLLDALSGQSEEAVMLAATFLGGEIPIAGGAAADDLTFDSVSVSLDDQVEKDALVLALLYSKKPLGIAVNHGHEPVSEPIKVTRSEGNTVHEINNQPAWDVWLKLTRDRAKKIGLDPDNLQTEDAIGDYLIHYEAGLATGEGYKIRVPLTLTQKSLNFACGIPEGTVLQITESIPERQIVSAGQAAQQAKAQINNASIAGALVFDCCCRKLILRNDFIKAVQAISGELGNVPIAGFETYGEIALGAGDMSGFHNTSTVILIFPS